MSFGGGSSGGTTTSQVTPYAPAEPALAQILSESGQLYNQGVGATGYVAPTQQTLTGLAQQEALGTASQQQLADTLSGKYLNPFLAPMIQKSAADIATGVQSQFSAAGRTPGSPMSQQQIVSQVAQAALPLAFGQYETERGRQLGIASRTPSLVQTGSQLENIQRQANLAPFQSLQQYSSLVNPIASGFPVQQSQTDPNRLTSATGGAMLGNMLFPGIGGAIGGALLGGLL